MLYEVITREYSLQQLADLVGAQVQGDPDLIIRGLNGIEQAKDGEITFVLDKKQLPLPENCHASACIAPVGVDGGGIPLLLTDRNDFV